MLRILGRGSKLCDGVNRREVLRAGALSLFGGLTLPRLLRAQETARRPGHAKSVIMFNLLGGPSHQDMVDLKPCAPLRRSTWTQPKLLEPGGHLRRLGRSRSLAPGPAGLFHPGTRHEWGVSFQFKQRLISGRDGYGSGDLPDLARTGG